MPNNIIKLFSSKRVKFISSLIFFLIFIYFIEKFLGWKTIIKTWSKFTLTEILVCFILFSFSYLIRSLRLYLYIFNKFKWLPFIKSFGIMLVHNFFNNIMPMRTGEAAFPLLLKKEFQISFNSSLPALLWFRLFDLTCLSIIGLITLKFEIIPTFSKYALSLIILISPFIIWILNKKLLPVIDNRNNGLFKLFEKILRSLPEKLSKFCLTYFLTMANWIIKILIFTFIIVSLIDINILTAILGSISGELSSILPIHGFAGAGTYETGVVAGLMLYNIPLKTAVSAATSLHLFILSATIITSIIGYIILLIKKD